MKLKAFKLLKENDFARAYRCELTSQLQLNFGNISLLFTFDEFCKFKNQLESTLRNIEEVSCAVRKDIFINTSVENIVFVFNYHELCKTHFIMVSSLDILESQYLILKN